VVAAESATSPTAPYALLIKEGNPISDVRLRLGRTVSLRVLFALPDSIRTTAAQGSC